MKKTNLVFLLLLIGNIFLLNSCASFGVIDKNLIIAPDPANPFQGTWVSPVSLPRGFIPDKLHVINGMNGEFHTLISGRNAVAAAWYKQVAYTIEKKDNGYMTSNNWQINITHGDNGDILTVDNITFERYVKK